MKAVLIASFNNPFAVEVLSRFHDASIAISAIVFCGDRADPRTRQTFMERMPSFIPRRIEELAHCRVPTYFVRNLNEIAAVELISSFSPDLLLQGGGPIYPSSVLEIPAIGTLNSHPGLLPRYRGCSVVEWAVYNDEAVGATCHFLDEGIDTGPIVCRATLDVSIDTTYEMLRTQMFNHQVETLMKGCRMIADGFRLGDAEPQSTGRSWPRAQDEIVEAVRNKLLTNSYRCYQCSTDVTQ